MWRKGKKLAQVARIQARGQLHIPQPGGQHEPEVEYNAALAALGLQEQSDDDDDTDDDPKKKRPPEDKCYLWPCNVATWIAWQNIRTQWRYGPKGKPSGLDYTAVTAYLVQVLRVKPKDRAEIFQGIQAMEFASLAVWQEQH